MEIHMTDDEIKRLHDFEFDLWSGTKPGLEWGCALKGIRTKGTEPPDFCGGRPAHRRRSHTNPANMIKTVNGGFRDVVAFSLKSRMHPRDWELEYLQNALYEETRVDDATVGHYACDRHDDQVFAPIDNLEAVKQRPEDPELALLFALRAVLMRYFLVYRHWRLFDRRSRRCLEAAQSIPRGHWEDDCRNNCRKKWRQFGETDRKVASRYERQVRALQQEVEHLVSLVKDGDKSRVVGKLIFVPGSPGMGGTMVYGQTYGGSVTCTVNPVADGHFVYVTRYKGIGGALARAATDLVLPNLSNAEKGQLVSELALQQNLAVFITMPKWRATEGTGEQDGIRAIAEQVYSSAPRRFRALKDDHRVPNLLS